MLDKFRDSVLIAKQKLSSSISLDAYFSLKEAMLGEGKKFTKSGMRPNQTLTLFYPTIPDEKYIFCLYFTLLKLFKVLNKICSSKFNRNKMRNNYFINVYILKYFIAHKLSNTVWLLYFEIL